MQTLIPSTFQNNNYLAHIASISVTMAIVTVTFSLLRYQIPPIPALKEGLELWIQVMATFAMEVKLALSVLAFVSMTATFLCATVGSAQRMPKATVSIIMDPMPVSDTINTRALE